MKTITLVFILSILFVKASYSQMFWNQTATFSGSSSSFISVPNSGTIDLTGSFSIEAWINPSTLFGASKGIISKGGLLGTSLKYAIRLSSAGRVTVITNGAQRIISRSSAPVTVNNWTHITATYNSSTSLFCIYLNGELDTSATVAGAAPTTNSDSLFVGISGASTPFSGQLDEVRLWNKDLNSIEVRRFRRTSMAEISGNYSALMLSMTFQDENSSGADFNTLDMTGRGNNGNAHNVTAVDQSNSPYTTIHSNQSVFFNGLNSYMAGKDTSTLDADTAVTLECWVFPETNSAATYISKGSSATPSYFLGWNGTKLIAKINGTQMGNSTTPVPINRWSHIAFRYRSSGPNTFFINGEQVWGGFDAAGNILNSNDSIYIGGGPNTLQEFSGYIDEVRITKNLSKSKLLIQSNIHNSIDNSNDPNPAFNDVVYNLDGSLVDNCNNGGPKLRFVGNAGFGHAGASVNTPISQLTRDESGNFSGGYYIKTPSVNFSPGTYTDSLMINEKLNINDINLFVGLQHSDLSDLDILLIGPNGDSVKIFNQLLTATEDHSISAIFDDQADSALSNLRFVTFSNTIRPANPLAATFNGDLSQGVWKLRIRNYGVKAGILCGWGVQVNNQTLSKLNFNSDIIIQGFYNATTDLMVQDTIKMYLRDFAAPHTLRDSSIVQLSNKGRGLFSFTKSSVFEKSLMIQLIHRNSIETWSSNIVFINQQDEEYSFAESPERAFGENEIQIDSSPLLFAIYGADVNQDGFVNLNDILQITNEASSFSSGYIKSDVTGDNIANLNDILLAFNNSNNFVHEIIP